MRGARVVLAAVCAAGCGVSSAKIGSEPLDLGDEGSELSASIPLVPLDKDTRGLVTFDSKTKYAAFEFYGNAGDVVSLYADHGTSKADSLVQLDTIVSLYKVSYLSGRPYGRAIAYNDDTESSGWTNNPYASSIEGFSLPQSRNYAIVVSTYQHAAGNASVIWTSTSPAPAKLLWSGTGPATSLDFDSMSASLVPVSQGVQDQVSSVAGQFHLLAARVSAAPADLQAVLADQTRTAQLGYDLLYNIQTKTGASHDVATVAPSSASSALGQLEQAADVSGLGVDGVALDHVFKVLVPSMFGDGNFATSRARAFKIHWDNADDMSADGVMVCDAQTGEVRVLAFIRDP